RRRFKCLIKLAQAQTSLYIPRWAPRRRDDAISMLCDEFGIHARPFAQLSFIGSEGREFEEIRKARGVFRQHGLVQISTGSRNIIPLLIWCAPQLTLLIKTRTGRHIRFNADNWLYSGFGHAPVESIGAKHIAVVCHPHSGLLLPRYLFCQYINLGHAIKHGKLSVVMKVYKGGILGHERHSSYLSSMA